MRPMFMAKGPAFRQKTLAPKDIHSVDIYLLMCRLLGLVPAPNNGTERVVRELLRRPPLMEETEETGEEYFGMVTTSILVTVISSTCAVVFVLAFVLLYRASSRKGRQYSSVQTVMKMGENGFSYKPVSSDGAGLLAGMDSDSEEDVFRSTA